MSQPLAESQSRTNCLSNDGWPWPGEYWSAGQNRELSGVSTSSMRMISAVDVAPLEFGVGDEDAALPGVLGAAPENGQAATPQLFGQLAAHQIDHPLERDILVVPAGALVEGVKMGSLSRALSLIPAGRRMPQTVPLCLYSCQPEPAR